jgi:hypothetical protein
LSARLSSASVPRRKSRSICFGGDGSAITIRFITEASSRASPERVWMRASASSTAMFLGSRRASSS